MKILIVEDHADTVAIFARFLARDGHAVMASRNAAGARIAAEEERYDVVLCDIGLPDGDGYSLFRELRSRLPGLRGIALTGYAMEEDVRLAQEAGFEMHIRKPVDLDFLRNAIVGRLNLIY